MSDTTLTIILAVGGVAFSIIGALSGLVVALMSRGADRRDRREEGLDGEIRQTKDRVTERHGSLSEKVSRHDERLDALEDTSAKIADALERLARLEEWRLGAGPVLEEANETSRTAIKLEERIHTAFKRLDTMDKKLDELPRQTAEHLRSMIRPVAVERAANG